MTEIIARIVEKFTMPLEPGAPEEPWFADWVFRSPVQAGVHLAAGWHALNRLREIYTPDDIQIAREYFGGMGAQAMMINHLFFPRHHQVMDYSKDATTHMRRTLPAAISVARADAYDPRSVGKADLVALDFGDLTVWKTRDEEPHRQLLDRVFLLEPKAVLLTDIACRYLHLHRERYETLLGAGTCETYETYLVALQRRVQTLYGYTPAVAYWDRWSTVMALVPQGAAPWGELAPTPLSPVGLDLF